MTPAEIRTALEQLAATVTQLDHAWLAVRDYTPQSHRAIIDDCLRALTTDTQPPSRFIAKNSDSKGIPPTAIPVDIELAGRSPYQSGVHFALYRYEERLGVYWQTLRWAPDETARGHFDARYAAADCIFSLHIERGYSIEAAVTLVYELALPVHSLINANQSALTPAIERIKAVEFIEHWSRLSPAARRTIEAEVQVLPEAERVQAFYKMAFLIAPRPKESP